MSFSSSFLLSNTCLLCIGFFNCKKNEKGNYRVKYVTDFKYWIFSNLRGFKKYNEKNFLGTFQQYNHLNTVMLKMLKTVFNFLTIKYFTGHFEEQLNSTLIYKWNISHVQFSKKSSNGNKMWRSELLLGITKLEWMVKVFY